MNNLNYTYDDYLREVIGGKNLQIAKRMLNDHFKKEMESSDPADFSRTINEHDSYPCKMAFSEGYGVCWLPGSPVVYMYGGDRFRIEIDCITMQCNASTKYIIKELETIVRKVFGGLDNARIRSWQVGRIKSAFAVLSDGVLCPADVITPVEPNKKTGRPPLENVRSMVKNDKPKRIKKRF